MLTSTANGAASGAGNDDARAEVSRDASYGTADLVDKLESEPNVKVQPPSAREEMFSQDDFESDTKAAEVRRPAGVRVSLRMLKAIGLSKL